MRLFPWCIGVGWGLISVFRSHHHHKLPTGMHSNIGGIKFDQCFTSPCAYEKYDGVYQSRLRWQVCAVFGAKLEIRDLDGFCHAQCSESKTRIEAHFTLDTRKNAAISQRRKEISKPAR